MIQQMTLALMSLFFVSIGAVRAESKGEARWNFDQETVGQLPAGFDAYSGQWVVRADPTAPSQPNVLAQEATRETWPGIVVNDSDFKNVVLEVKFKPVSGDEDQAAGIIFRYKDKDNFYVFRANADEDNAVLFKFVNGHRSEIKGAGVKVPHNVWSSITVMAVDDKITCFFNGKELFTVKNNLYQHGKIGLWTKADSVTHFDNFTAKPYEK